MKTTIYFFALAALLASFSQAQQTPSTPQPTQQQTAPAAAGAIPCSNSAPPKPHNQGWLERKARALACQKNPQLCSLPNSTDDALGTAKPCPPTATPSTPTTQPAPALHLPTGVITTWLCNPIVTSTDPSHTTTFITPDALTNAEPAQPGVFEADGAKADAKATVSCANLRRDPKTNKVFLAQ
ncbi:MAG TPA: hypothetical protein VMI06_01595 [Terriglobia bacterium]|nr:hypothetical protein [Terriglobia bacterium]